MRTATSTTSTLVYFLGDHLGSTSLTVTPEGSATAEMLYLPWGETRYSMGTTPTEYRYTGQRSESAIGLYYNNARWYDPALSRFIQADTIVPGGVQGLDRYAYTNNNPTRNTDPTGHYCIDKVEAGGRTVYNACEDDSGGGYHPPKKQPTFSSTSNDISPEEMDYLDKIFDPYYGPEYISNQTPIPHDKWSLIEDLYVIQNIDILEIARMRGKNPITFNDIRDVNPELGVSLVFRAQHHPYQMFLIKMRLPHDNTNENISVYEPKYLQALMDAFPHILDQAKIEYYNIYQNEVYKFMQKYIDNWPGND